MLERLAETRTLWMTFAATILITLGFPIAASTWGLTFIDGMSDPAVVRQAMMTT